jgi:hypothetical protein
MSFTIASGIRVESVYIAVNIGSLEEGEEGGEEGEEEFAVWFVVSGVGVPFIPMRTTKCLGKIVGEVGEIGPYLSSCRGRDRSSGSNFLSQFLMISVEILLSLPPAI